MSYASYCQDQATACARRARLASSPEIVAYCRNLQFRWLRLAAQAQATGGALGRESAPAASLGDTIAATCPVEYGKRAGELIARGAPADLQWFWAITGIFGTPADMRMDGHAPTLESAQAQLGESWRKWLAWAKLAETEG